jgi:hypothetical protein
VSKSRAIPEQQPSAEFSFRADQGMKSHPVVDRFAVLLERLEVFALGLLKVLAQIAFVHLQRFVDKDCCRVEHGSDQCRVTPPNAELT